MFKKCDYIISAVSKKQFPNQTNLPEFVFLGRSNVGKSSFINFLTNRKMLARTSSKPGKTQTINFFLIDEMFYLVDVPGYGYASTNKDTTAQFGNYIEEYLENNPNLKIAFLLVDTKVGPTHDDILMYDYMKYLNLNVKVIATKSDKIGTTLIPKHKKNIYTKLKCDMNDVLVTSSEKKQGLDNVLKLISQYL